MICHTDCVFVTWAYGGGLCGAGDRQFRFAARPALPRHTAPQGPGGAATSNAVPPRGGARWVPPPLVPVARPGRSRHGGGRRTAQLTGLPTSHTINAAYKAPTACASAMLAISRHGAPSCAVVGVQGRALRGTRCAPRQVAGAQSLARVSRSPFFTAISIFQQPQE